MFLIKKVIFLFSFFITYTFSYSQNLVSNNSFEEHRNIECSTCHLSASNFAGTMTNWVNLNTNPFICDCDYNYNLESRICQSNKLSPLDGCTMMEMLYKPNCVDFAHETNGCASYIGTRLKTPLKLGVTYEVSFWLYIDQPEDIDYTNHIGFTLFPDVIRNPNGAMIEENTFTIDSVIYNNWYKVSWNIQPTCLLNFFVIGVFKNEAGPPIHSKDHENIYYVDQVEIKSFDKQEDPSKKDSIESLTKLFCKPSLNVSSSIVPEITGLEGYFKSNSFECSTDLKSALDFFAVRAKLNPKVVFTISGHTDNIGRNHMELSKQRIDNVLTYLNLVHQIPKERFIASYMGASKPKYTNKTAEGRRMNRRIVISHSDYEIASVIYRKVLESVFEGNTFEAFKLLNKWLYLSKHSDKILMLNDPRLSKLKKVANQWNHISTRVRKDYFKKYASSSNIAFSLDSLWAEDQKARDLSYQIENISLYLEEVDTNNSKWDVSFDFSIADEIKTNERNFNYLIKLIGDNYWTKSSTIGERGAKANFLIVQHHSKTSTLVKYLPLLKQRCLEGEAPWIYYATMYDRWRLSINKPQKFGTQFEIVDGSKKFFLLEDEQLVNQWRQEIGLPSID